MSQQDMIRQGEIQKRKQEQLLAVTSAKAALRALVNDATYSISKPVSEINTALLSAHLFQSSPLIAEGRYCHHFSMTVSK